MIHARGDRPINLLALALALLAVAQGPTARAQDSSRSVREARERFQRGLDLVDEGNYSAALTEFQRAYELTSNPLVLFNLSATHEALGHFVEALEWMRRFEREAPPMALRDRRALVDGAIARLQGRIGTLVLETDPPDAELLVDGIARPIREARAGMRIDAGRHRITVRAPGHVAREEIIDVAGETTARLTVQLERARSTITVRSNVTRAEVRVDGVSFGRTPLVNPISVSEGAHVVEVTREGYSPFRQEVIAAGLGVEVRARLAWDPSLDARTGARVRVSATEPNIIAQIDGRQVRVDASELVPPGPHTLRVEHRDFLPVEREVELPAGRVSTIEFALTPTPVFRAQWMSDAYAARRNAWVVVGIGATIAVGALSWLSIQGAAYAADLAERERAERAVQQCGGCVEGMALARALADARDRVTLSEILLGLAGGMTAIGATGVTVGALLLRGAPRLDRFERRPMVWVVPGRAGFSLRW